MSLIIKCNKNVWSSLFFLILTQRFLRYWCSRLRGVFLKLFRLMNLPHLEQVVAWRGEREREREREWEIVGYFSAAFFSYGLIFASSGSCQEKKKDQNGIRIYASKRAKEAACYLGMNEALHTEWGWMHRAQPAVSLMAFENRFPQLALKSPRYCAQLGPYATVYVVWRALG
jgi:hypothetical protein